MVMESSYPDGSVPVGGRVFPPEHLPLPAFTANGCSPLLGDPNANSLSEIFLDQYTEVDLSSEWLSSFVEECLSSAGNCFNLTTTATTTTEANTTVKNPNPSSNSSNSKGNINSPQKTPSTYRNSGVPGKPRSQRKRRMTSANAVVDPSSKTHKSQLIIWPDQYHHHLNRDAQLLQLGFSDPPLLEQAYWLADSELILPQKEGEEDTKEYKDGVEEEENGKEVEQQKKKKKKMVGKKKEGGGEEVFEENNGGGAGEQQPRRCSHCQAQKTPQWRAGPLGPKTLCNACGVRYFKSGRLLPEYRPAKSPTFVSYKHSNSHKKVLQMRMAIVDDSNLV